MDNPLWIFQGVQYLCDISLCPKDLFNILLLFEHIKNMFWDCKFKKHTDYILVQKSCTILSFNHVNRNEFILYNNEISVQQQVKPEIENIFYKSKCKCPLTLVICI